MVFRWLFLLLPLSVWGEDPWGDEESLPKQRSLPSSGLLMRCAEQAIAFHREVISPVDGPRSHFRPTSSRYALLSMQRHGVAKGFFLGCDRLIRENSEPWCYRMILIDGMLYQWDPVPE
ncbi:MAG: membrane protein insertion efficiency factor YidD [Chlamydiota bacterium]|nr:membrane protein insertion efficiency factor YidD [Chlamydiota bacterium]